MALDICVVVVVVQALTKGVQGAVKFALGDIEGIVVNWALLLDKTLQDDASLF